MPSHRKQVTYSSRPNHAARSAHAKGERQFRTYDTSYIRPKRSKAPLVFAAVLAVVVVGGLAWGALTLFNSCSGTPAELLAEGEEATIVVSEGSGAQAVGSDLQRARLVGTVAEFPKRVTELGMESSLKPGTYTFAGGTSLDDIIARLAAGPEASGASLTIPEGFTLANTAARVAEVTEGRITAEDFAAAASDASVYAADFPFLAEGGTHSLEGFLFPKTYTVTEGATADSLVRAMLTQYQSEVAGLDYSYAESQGLTAYDVLKLASIVERESDPEHFATVASVFYNRLASDRPYLESDATTAYEVGRTPTADEVHADTPYSTYANPGLPPTPICAPSIEALKAVCAPEQTDYLYFYTKPLEDGGAEYHFSVTYEEHQDAINS